MLYGRSLEMGENMSYCVNCGVELDKTATACALCNTPVLNPKQPIDNKVAPPFPVEKGQVETVNRKDMAILLTTVVLASAITCTLLNLFVFQKNLWSLAVIGVCAILWVSMIPVVIRPGQSLYLSILYDGAVAAGYLYLLTWMSHNDRWFWGLGFPLVIYITAIAELVILCYRKLPLSFLTMGIYAVTAAGILCGGIEVLIDRYLTGMVALKWSAVVLTVCGIIDIALVTMLSLRRIRNVVRKRFHF